MAIDLGNLSIGIVPQLAALDALEARLAVLDRQPHMVSIGVDTNAIGAAEQKVTSLGTAHQALGSKSVTLGMDVSQVETARSSIKNLDNDLLSLAGSVGKVGAAFAAPVAFGALTKFAADYQTTLTETANQTTLAADGIALMDKTIRDLPSGGAPLKDLATGFKNITDLGYSAADAQKIATEESKAATETGANQATVMLAVTSAMKEYNATADQVGKYTNITAQAAKEANSSLQAWTEGTRTGVAVAAAYGVSLQEADAFMVALTRHGFDAAESATQLRGVIQHIVNPGTSAQAAIAQVTKATGIDLVTDFSDEGLKARGFANIMADLQAVIDKTGDESIITRLIPALRGGQGALITVTQAAEDAKGALADLGAAGDGSLKPVEDGFARIQNTAGYQFGQTMKQIKLDLIDVGQAGLPPITALAEGLGKVPAPVIEGTVRLLELGAALKTANAAGDLLTGMWEKITASTAASTTATTAQAAAETDAAVATGAHAAAVADETTVIETNTAAKLANAKASAGSVAGSILGGLGPLVGIGEGLNVFPKVAGDLKGGDFKQAFGDFLRNMPGTPQGLASLVGNVFGVDIYRELKDKFGINLGVDGSPPPAASTPAAAGSATGSPAAKGAGLGLPSETEQKQLDQQAKDFAKSQADYFKQLDKDVADARKQAQTDAVKAEKDRIQEAGDAAVAQATRVADAWKAAGQAVASVSPDKGIQGLIDGAPKLYETTQALGALGQHDSALSDLTDLAEMFHGWAADTDKATEALRGYNLTLAQTDQAIKDVGSLKSEYLAALDAAEKRQKAGTADASDIAIINARSTALNALDQQTSKLQQQGNVDILGKLANLPDYATLNQNLSNLVTSLGGGRTILDRLTVDKTQAEQELKQFEDQARQSVVKIKADTKDAIADIDKFLLAIPSDKTVTFHYQTPDGKPLTMAQIDNPGGPGAYGPPDETSWGAYGRSAAPGASGGGGSASVPSASATSPLGFQPLALADYRAIINQGGNGASPLDDPQVYQSFIQAAQQSGVDPRLLLSRLQYESQFGRSSSLDLNMANNFAGIKFANQPGARPGPTSTEGDPYAAFGDPGDFFKALAANVSTGIYADPFKSGDLSAILKNYVVGPNGTASPDQQANIQNSLAYYQRLVAQYPGIGGGQGKGSGGTLPGYGPGDTGLGSGQNPTGGALNTTTNISSSSIVDEAKKHLNEMTQIDGEPWYLWCEKFVDNQLQAVTGSTYRPASADQRVRDAMNGVAGAGTIVSASQARAGDLVAWSGSSDYAGSKYGHVGINEGNGNYIGTTSKGIQERPIGPDAVFIRPDGVVAAGPEPGSVMHTSTPSQRASTGYGPGTYASTGGTASGTGVPATINATGGVQQATVSAQQLQAALDAVNTELSVMDKRSVAGVKAELQGIIPTLEQMREKEAQIGDTPLTSEEKKQADAAAWQDGLQYAAEYARTVQDIEDHTDTLAFHTERLAEIIGGPMADAYAKAAVASAQVTAATSEIARLTAEHDQQQAAHQAEDQAASRQKTIDGWIAQDNQARMQQRQQIAQERLQDKQTAENDRYTQVQRDEQDRQRALQFSQQVQATELQNKLTDLQKSQQNTTYNRTAQEQLQESSIRGANTNLQAGMLSQVLAGMHDHDLAQKDLDNKAVEGIQLQIREQAKAANLESYNLETETIAEQRKHENIIRDLTAQGVAQQRTFQREQQAEQEHAQAVSRADTIAQWQLQDKRAKEDEEYKAAILAQNTIKDTATAALDVAKNAILAWQQTGQVIQVAASNAASLGTNSNPSGIGNTATNVTAGTFGQGGNYVTKHATGGSFVGAGIVGDRPDGTLTPYSELVIAPQGATVVPLHASPAGEGANAINFNFGDISLDLSEQDKADIKAYITNKIVASQSAGIKHKRARGLG